YDRLTRRIWLLLALGLMSSYIANVLRMVVIVLVGYYADSGQADLQNMLIAHSYAGWIIFLAWIALFWGALFKFLPEARPSLTPGAQLGTPARKESRCGICTIPLSPSLPATRCVCGAYYHRACLASQGRCPTCGNPLKLESVVGGTASQFIRRAATELERLRPNVVHAQGHWYALEAGIRYRRNHPGTLVVFTLHTPFPPRSWWRRYALKFVLSKADFVTGVSA